MSARSMASKRGDDDDDHHDWWLLIVVSEFLSYCELIYVWIILNVSEFLLGDGILIMLTCTHAITTDNLSTCFCGWKMYEIWSDKLVFHDFLFVTPSRSLDPQLTLVKILFPINCSAGRCMSLSCCLGNELSCFAWDLSIGSQISEEPCKLGVPI